VGNKESERTKDLTEAEVDALHERWLADGFVLEGNGFLDRDDPPECPFCGEPDFFYALYGHPTRTITTIADDGEQFTDRELRVLNHCYECDCRWEA
jgi:hypothetical protein